MLASQPIDFAGDGKIQTQNVLFSAGDAGAKTLQFSIDPLPDETNRANNAVTRLVNVVNDKRRILYVEGEPRWEYKFIRRAEDDDRVVQIVSMLRTTENKIYRQGIDDPNELADGFPSKPEDLFGYQALIIGSVEAGYFTPAQQDLIRQFVDRRGGGLLFLGGRFALADGGWGGSSLADLLPTILPTHKNTFHRDPATVQLTPAGEDSLITRLIDDPARNGERWKKLPYLMDYQEPGTPKPGAAVLAEMKAGGREMPLLVTQNYRPRPHRAHGHLRHVALADEPPARRHEPHACSGSSCCAGSWPTRRARWSPLCPAKCSSTTGTYKLSADVRDKEYLPAPDAPSKPTSSAPMAFRPRST